MGEASTLGKRSTADRRVCVCGPSPGMRSIEFGCAKPKGIRDVFDDQIAASFLFIALMPEYSPYRELIEEPLHDSKPHPPENTIQKVLDRRSG